MSQTVAMLFTLHLFDVLMVGVVVGFLVDFLHKCTLIHSLAIRLRMRPLMLIGIYLFLRLVGYFSLYFFLPRSEKKSLHFTAFFSRNSLLTGCTSQF